MICLELTTISSPPLNLSHLHLNKRFHLSANRYLVNFLQPRDSSVNTMDPTQRMLKKEREGVLG